MTEITFAPQLVEVVLTPESAPAISFSIPATTEIHLSEAGGSAVVSWSSIADRPEFAAVATSGAYGDLTGRPILGSAAAMDAAAFATAAQGQAAMTALQPGDSVPWADLTGVPGLFDGVYGHLSGIPTEFAPAAHDHDWGDLTGVPGLFDGVYGHLSGIPTAFAPAAHDHDWGDLTGVPVTLAGYGIIDAQPLAAVLSNTTAAYTVAQAAKLSGVEDGAQVNLPTDLTYDAPTRGLASSTGADVVLPLVSDGAAGLAPASGGGTAHYLRADGQWAAPDAGGAAPLGLHDWWFEQRFASTDAAQGLFLGAAISSGTNNQPITAATIAGFNPFGLRLRSSATQYSGYRLLTSSLVSDYFGVISHKFRGQYSPMTLTDTYVRLGYFDSNTSTDPTDGVYFLQPGSSAARFVVSANGVQVNSASFALTSSATYTIEVDVAADGASARCRLWEGAGETPVLDHTFTSGIPTGLARAVGAGAVAWSGGLAVSDLCVIYGMGLGTVAGFNRARVS